MLPNLFFSNNTQEKSGENQAGWYNHEPGQVHFLATFGRRELQVWKIQEIKQLKYLRFRIFLLMFANMLSFDN